MARNQRCWSLSNSEGVSAYNGRSRKRSGNLVLVAFKQRRCFSSRHDRDGRTNQVLVAFKQRRCFS